MVFTDDEDIDIVGDCPKANTSLSSASSSSRDLQTHVYGPPQYTEADVLACVKESETKMEQDDEGEAKTIKKEAEEEEGEEATKEEDEEKENVETLKAKLREMKGGNNCSKCKVRNHFRFRNG